MPTFEIVCLANSRKRQGRCVAGLRMDGKGWLRPIGSNPEGILHPHHYMLPDDTEPQLGDVLRVHCSRPHPQPHHPEDWIVMSLPWERVLGAAESNRQEWLRPYLSPGPQLLGSVGDRVAAEYVTAHPVANSLALVAPQNLRWHIAVGSNGERRTRVMFTLNGAEYNLSLTDPVWEQRILHLKTGTHPRRMADVAENAEVWLTVSLSEPFAKVDGEREFCYKMVAGVVVFTAQAELSPIPAAGGRGSKRSVSQVALRRKKTPSLPAAYTSAPDLAAYPDPFADDLPLVAVTEGRPPVTAGVIPNEMRPSPPLVVPEVAAAITEAVPIAPENSQVGIPAEVSRQSRQSRKRGNKRGNTSDVKADENTTTKPNDRANGKWDNQQDKLLWQKQRTRMRSATSLVPVAWSEDEDALLLRLASDGETAEEIAAQVGRTLEGVTGRLKELT